MIGRSERPDGPARAAATEVVDPTTGLTLGELDLVVDAVTRRSQTVVRVVLPSAEGTQADLVRAAVADRVRTVASTDVQVEVRAMTSDQRGALGRSLRYRSRRPGAMGSPTAVYAVASGKGGVGKSTVTANLAVALARQGKRVGVLDADVWGYSMPHLFGVREAPLALGGIMLPMPAHGTVMMSTGFFVDDSEPVVWRGPMLHKALEQFLDDVYWGELDALVVDLPPGTGDVSMSVIELLPTASMLVVTTPNAAAENVAARVGRMARDARLPVSGVVENMSGAVCLSCGDLAPVFGSGGGERLAANLDVPLLAQLPLDPGVASSGESGVPVVAADPDGRVGRAFATLVRDLPVVRPSLVGKSLPLFVGS